MQCTLIMRKKLTMDDVKPCAWRSHPTKCSDSICSSLEQLVLNSTSLHSPSSFKTYSVQVYLYLNLCENVLSKRIMNLNFPN